MVRAEVCAPGGSSLQRKHAMAAAALLLAAALLPAFALASTRTTGVRAVATVRPPATGPTLRLALPDASVTVDPALVADEANVQLASLLYSGLVRLDSSYHVVPDAAVRIDVSRDHRVYTFHLRRGLRFSNGDPLVAADFAYAITRSLDPALKSPSAPTYLLDIKGARAVLEGKAKSVSGIKVLNRSTLQITARWPVPYLLMELTYPTSFALDEHSIRKLGSPDTTAWYANPIGTGPYRLKSWVPNSTMILTRNPYFAGTRPQVKTIVITLAPLSGTGTDLYRYVTHTTDVVSLPAYDSSLRDRPGIHESKMLSIAGVYMSYAVKPFDDPRVRLALTRALNRPTLLTGTMSKIVTPFAGYVPPGEAGYDRKLRVLGYDPVVARRELATAGYPAGKNFPSITLYYGSDPNDPVVARLIQHLAQRIARDWTKTLRISVNTHGLTLNTLYAKAESNTLAVYLSGWSADYPDAHDWLSAQWRTKSLNNNVGFSDTAFDRVVETADVTWSESQRAALYDRAQQMLVNDVAWIPLYIPHRLVYIRPTVNNLRLTGYGLIPRSGSWAQVQVSAVSAKKQSRH